MSVLIQSNSTGIDVRGALLTDRGGPSQRLRVDAAQTSFFAGREARTFYDLSLATATSVVIKAVVPIDIILNKVDILINTEEILVETVMGGTEGGTFSITLPIFPANTMAERPLPLYTFLTVLTAGGTHTGGTVLDIIRLKTGGATQQAISVGSSPFDERGVAANTYYFRLTNLGNGPLVGVFKARWEERLP